MLSSPLINTGKVTNRYRPCRLRVTIATASVALLATVTACGSSTSASTSGSQSVRMGLFPNVTQAPALVGVADGIFAKDLAPDTLAAPRVFQAGPAENQALLSGSLDIAFEGPSSALSAYSESHAVTVVAGVTSGGAGLVTKGSITSPTELKGTTLASPQLANTQDVALRFWLATHGYRTTGQGGDRVTVQPSSTGNGTIVTEFEAGTIDGAWVPEPYESEMIADGGHLLVNEANLWPLGHWATTSVVVRTAYLKAHPATVRRFLTGLVDTISGMKGDPASAQAATNRQLATLRGGKPLTARVLSSAFGRLMFTTDPLASTYTTQAAHGVATGLLKNPGPLGGLFYLQALNAVLKSKDQAEVTGP